MQLLPSARGFGSAINQQIGGDVDQAGRAGGQRMGSSWTAGFGAAVGRLAVAGGAALAAVGVLGAKAGIETAAGMEQASIAFTTMLGDGKKAASFLKSLADFAAATPFEFPELQTAASSLISAGISADKVIPIMRTLGDVTSGMGTGSEGVKRATIALQQMSAAGRITGEDLNQLRDAGVPVFDLLAAATGRSKEAIADLAAKGKLGKRELEAMMKALESGKGLERFNGLMEKQSQSMTGLWSTLKDTLNVGLAQAITPMIPAIKDGLGGAIKFLAEWLPKVGTGIQSVVTWFQGFGQASAGAASTLSRVGPAIQGLVQAAGPMLTTFGQNVMGIVNAIRGFVDVALPIVQQFVDGMRQRLEPMMPTFQSIFETVGGIVSAAMELMQAIIERVTSVIKVIWDDYGQNIMDVISTVWGIIGPIIEGALKFIQGVIKTVTSIIKGDWSGAWENIKGAFSGAWDGIKQGLGRGAEWLLDQMRQLPGRILGALGNLGSLLMDKGTDLVRGLIDGIAGMGGRLVTFVRQFMLDHIPGPVREVLGINSPSRVMRDQVGQWIPLGLADGIRGRAGVVDAAMRSLVRVPQVPTLAAAGPWAALGGAAGGPSTVVLRVGDREFTAYVDERAGAVISGVGDLAATGRRAY